MRRKILTMITIFSFSINPFFKKMALDNIDRDSGYILTQISNFSLVFLYSLSKLKSIKFDNLKIKNISYMILSTLLTLSGSLSMTESLKDNNNISVHMANINSLNILCSFIIDSCIKHEEPKNKTIFGIIFICYGIKLLN
jgi:uncharacterized membrane protein